MNSLHDSVSDTAETDGYLNRPPDVAKPNTAARSAGRQTFEDLLRRVAAISHTPLVLHRPRRSKTPRPVNCLNCSESLTGNFCANCGQEATDQRAALWPLVSDLLSEFARWDSKFFRTLVPLIFRPGFLTAQYIDGKRASYLAPFRLFLTVTVLFFVLVSWHTASINNPDRFLLISDSRFATLDTSQSAASPSGLIRSAQPGTSANDNAKADAEATKDLNDSLADASDSLPAPLRAKIKLPHLNVHVSSPSDLPSSAAEMTGPDGNSFKEIWDKLPTEPAATDQQLTWAASPTAWNKVPLLYPRKQSEAREPRDSGFSLHDLPTTAALYRALENNRHYPHHDPAFLQRLVLQLYKFGTDHSALTDELINLAPKIAIVMVPIFAMLLYPLYLRTHRYYVEHLVFALHNHTFLFLALSVTIFAPLWLTGLLYASLVVYMYASMKIVYRQHWFKTLMKFLFVGWNYSIIIGIAAALTMCATLLFG